MIADAIYRASGTPAIDRVIREPRRLLVEYNAASARLGATARPFADAVARLGATARPFADAVARLGAS